MRSEIEGLKDRPEAENLVVLYAALAVIELGLLVRYAKAGPAPIDTASAGDADQDPDRPMAFAY